MGASALAKASLSNSSFMLVNTVWDANAVGFIVVIVTPLPFAASACQAICQIHYSIAKTALFPLLYSCVFQYGLSELSSVLTRLIMPYPVAYVS
jgi:hypothetical protein